LTDDPTGGNGVATPREIETRQIVIDGQLLQVAIRHGSGQRPPLLLFNGIGANWELARPFLEALTSTTAIIFDVPGVGGSPRSLLPYRPSTLARLAAGLVAELGYAEIDVAGVSWAAESRSSSRINIQISAGGWCSLQRRPGLRWCRQTPQCC
jgi:pimeloyl-ACP methyl ester carboxylesterase